MDFKQFQDRALSTESRPSALCVGPVSMHVVLSAAIAAGAVVELVKKRAFYGKSVDFVKLSEHARKAAELFSLVENLALDGVLEQSEDRDIFTGLPDGVERIAPELVNLRLLHAALGMFGESSEVLELVRGALEGKPLDRVKMGLEIADSDWYRAVALDELGVSQDEIWHRLFAKLLDKQMGRYKDGNFSADAAVNRNETAEQAAAEAA